MSVLFCKIMKTVDSGKTIKELLGDLVRKQTVYRYNRNFEVEGREFDNVLDLKELGKNYDDKIKEGFVVGNLNGTCNEEKRYLSRGFKVEKREDNGWTFYSRPYDDKVAQCLGMEPVSFGYNGENIKWFGNYRCNKTVAPTISKFFPEVKFELIDIVENEVISKVIIQNGQVIKEIALRYL